MGTMTKREIILQKEGEGMGARSHQFTKSLLPEFGSRRPQLKDAADQTFSPSLSGGRSRWQVRLQVHPKQQ